MIKIYNLCLSFTKEYYALYNINLEINKNQKVAIVGEADSGKTTLLRTIAGLEEFNKGNILIDDKSIKKIDFSSEVNLGYISYKGVFFNNRTVKQNLEYVLKIRKADEINSKIKINQALKEYKIEHLKDIKIKALNEYQKVLVQFARISLRKIDIYLVDNIFKNLTEQENTELINIIKTLQKSQATFVIATKDKNIASQISDRIVYIKYGSIVNGEEKNEK